MNGGGLLSEGGFGCIYHPALNCNGKETEDLNFVSKIQKNNKSAKNEINISNILKTVNGYKNYFRLVNNSCGVDIGKMETNNKNQCGILKNTDEKFILMKMHYIEGELFINHLVNNKNNIESINNIINNYNHLLYSISILIKKNVVHFDIKNGNIMFNTKKKTPIIIDFGISINMESEKYKSLKEFFYVFEPKYYIWPIEVHYLCFLVNENDEPEINELYNIVNAYVDNNNVMSLFFSDFILQYKELCVKQLMSYNKLPYNERVTTILKYWKIDMG